MACVALPFALATPALAAAPVGFIDDVDITGATTASVRNHVNPNGTATSAYLEYGASSSNFCTSGGVDPGGRLATAAQLVGSSVGNFQVTIPLSGLTQGASYCVQLVTTNSTDPAYVDFYDTFFAGLPASSTYEVHSTGPSSVAVTGAIDANGQATTVFVRYDTEASVFCLNNGQGGAPQQSIASVSGGSANGTVDVTVNVNGEAGVTPGAAGCVQLIAQNGSGFSRPDYALPVVVGQAEVLSQYIQGTSPTSVRAVGQIWTAGQATSVRVEYAEGTSDFCANDGLSGVHGTTAGQTVPSAATEQTAVESIAGLDATKEYCYRWVADTPSVAGATLYTSSFAGGGPDVTTLAASTVGSNGATLNAAIIPGASPAMGYFELALSSSLFCQTGGLGEGMTTRTMWPSRRAHR